MSVETDGQPVYPSAYKIEGHRLIPIYGPVVVGVHSELDCHGMPCVVHSPTQHHMRGWDLRFRRKRGIFERLCPHGFAHPDPDQFPHWRASGALHQAMHSCCGCCGEREARRVH